MELFSGHGCIGPLFEVASGQNLTPFSEKIFHSVDMVDTSFYFDPERRSARLFYIRATFPLFLKDGFLSKSTGPGLSPHEFLGYTDKGMFESGGAGLLSTTRDYLQFPNMLLNDGELDGVRILSPNSIATMCTTRSAAQSL